MTSKATGESGSRPATPASRLTATDESRKSQADSTGAAVHAGRVGRRIQRGIQVADQIDQAT